MKPWKFWLALAAVMAVIWYLLVGCLLYKWLGWACLPAFGKAAGIAAFFVTLVVGGMCCSSGNRTNEYISQEAAHGVFDED